MNLKNKLKYLLGLFLSINLLFFLTAPALADTQVYPPSPATTPYGDGSNNTTNAGWTDNHMVGESFVVPSNVGKITQVQLTGFKLGDTKNDGLYSVALFQGEPTTANVTVAPGIDTRRIYAGAKLAQVEKIFVPGQMGGGIDRLCQASSTTAGWLMTRMRINNPDRPCPSRAEWTRMWCLLNGMDTSACYGGAPQPYYSWYNQGSLDEMVGWFQWEERQGPTGDSEFLWQPTDSKDLPPLYYGPGGSWTSTRGGKNRIADVTLQVNLPDNTVTPGQTYFISIQGSHTDPYMTGGSGYYEDGRYNCMGPNESGPMSFWGVQNGTGNIIPLNLDTYYCGKYDPMVANISMKNPYWYGSAYFNTYYYYGGGDVTNLTIWGTALGPIGSFDGGTCATTLTGWTCDADSYSTPLRVDFYTDGPAGVGTGLGSTTAGLSREAAVANLCGGNSNHGFSFAIPANSLRDGKSHDIYAYGINIGSGSNILLPGSPVSTTCPSLGPLQINADISTGSQAKGNYTISGLRADPGQGGNNYYNAITITQNVNNGADINLVGTAFTSKASPPPTNATLSQLMTSADADNGFILIYANKNDNVGGQPFSAGNYYIYFSGNWASFTSKPYPEPQNRLYVKVGDGSNPPSAPQFSVTLYNPLGSHTWGTYSYFKTVSSQQSSPAWPSN